MKGRRVSGGEVRLVSVESNQFQYQNFQSRARLDARLWLNCRLALVHALNAEIRGMGEVKGKWQMLITSGNCVRMLQKHLLACMSRQSITCMHKTLYLYVYLNRGLPACTKMFFWHFLHCVALYTVA